MCLITRIRDLLWQRRITSAAGIQDGKQPTLSQGACELSDLGQPNLTGEDLTGAEGGGGGDPSKRGRVEDSMAIAGWEDSDREPQTKGAEAGKGEEAVLSQNPKTSPQS